MMTEAPFSAASIEAGNLLALAPLRLQGANERKVNTTIVVLRQIWQNYKTNSAYSHLVSDLTRIASIGDALLDSKGSKSAGRGDT